MNFGIYGQDPTNNEDYDDDDPEAVQDPQLSDDESDSFD